jgi:hypothetical protein
MQKPKNPIPERRIAQSAEWAAHNGFFNVAIDLWQALADLEARKRKPKRAR